MPSEGNGGLGGAEGSVNKIFDLVIKLESNISKILLFLKLQKKGE